MVIHHHTRVCDKGIDPRDDVGRSKALRHQPCQSRLRASHHVRTPRGMCQASLGLARQKGTRPKQPDELNHFKSRFCLKSGRGARVDAVDAFDYF